MPEFKPQSRKGAKNLKQKDHKENLFIKIKLVFLSGFMIRFYPPPSVFIRG
jgi:hypothetical protein